MLHHKQKPLVSIITITYNSESSIEDTIGSLLNQTYSNIEYIIVDGNSSDKTVSIINSYTEKIKERNIMLKFLSENDEGIADAWNKGLKLATGDIIGMLNSDDWFDDNSIESAVNCLDIKKAQLSYGICYRVNDKKEVIEIMNREFNPNLLYLNFGFSYTTCFVTKKMYNTIGLYNLNYKIAIDTDFLLRAYNHGFKFIKCSNITYMRLGGVSTKFKKAALKEHQQAMMSNGFNPILIFIFGMVKKGVLILQNLKLI